MNTTTSRFESPNPRTQQPVNADAPIHLQVGERFFTTRRETLTRESSFFASLLSGRWWTSQSANSSFFIDANADLFEHILGYLRRGRLPLFWDKDSGFDEPLYSALLEEARFFNIIKLEQWIVKKAYLDVVRVVFNFDYVQGPLRSVSGHDGGELWPNNVEKTFHPCVMPVYQYWCPQNWESHHGRPEKCGALCHAAPGYSSNKSIRQGVVTLVVEKITTFNLPLCINWEL